MFSVPQKKVGVWMLFPSFRCILQLDFCTAKSGNMTFFPSQISLDKNWQLIRKGLLSCKKLLPKLTLGVSET